MNPWIIAIRPKTLIASFSPVLVGNALAFHSSEYSWLIAISSFICALCLQVTVNFANDYFDHKHQVDTNERLGPLRACQSGLISPTKMKLGIVASISLAIISGLILVTHSDIWIFILGLLSIICALLYSGGKYPLANFALGEVTVFAFFGPIAVVGSYYLQTQDTSMQSWVMGAIFGLLNAAIMFTNNTRDIRTDIKAGKHTLAVKLTKEMCSPMYRAMILGAYALLFFSYFLGLWKGLPVLFTGIWVFYAQIISKRFENASGKEFNSILESTSKLTLLTSVCFSLSYLY
ncbi:1,4-dihydroxy-2-naphthoate polyprenyltransferase [Shewanella sp. OPT22]|nr:1,4-dihydroxy-2-naphthoate polyprenyltransferase [Shewanella sp. OPT22]